MTRRGSLALTLLAVVLALAGLTAGYVRWELAEPDRFADRAVDALRSKEVRVAIAEQVAVAMVERGSPDLVASRPLMLAAVEAILETDEFGRVMRRSAIAAHRVLFRGDTDVLVELQEARDLLVPAVESVSPGLARQIPPDLRPKVAEIRGSDAATWTVRVVDSASAAALPLLIAAAVALGLAVALAPDRHRALATAGLALAAGGAGGLAVMTGLRAQVVGHAGETGVLSDDDAQAAAGAAWDALAGGLQQWFLVAGIAGLAIAAGALLAEARVDRAGALGHAAAIVAGGELPPATKLLRGMGLAAVGALILLGTEPLLRAAVTVLGGVLVLLGLTEALSTLPRRGGPARPRAPLRRGALVAAGLAIVLAVVAIPAVLLSGGGPPAPPERSEITACNGLAVLCDRRLDEVVLPGTHNSMAAADRPGWFFANQTRPVPRQLSDGIRLLMIDPHYGVVDSQGRVRTDVSREGTSRNRVARQLGVEAVRVAERLAGRIGLVPAHGEAEIFLCHTLCELGAERLSSTLDEIRGFLERNPSEVVVLFIESSVDPEDVEREFEEADLETYLATLSRTQPLPTLGAMIGSGRRLVVFDQGDGGGAPWYQPAYVFMQGTLIRSLVESPAACDPGRGTPESPLLLINHWIDRFPPPLTENREVGTRRALLRRVRACREQLGRPANFIAVDFYEGGDVIGTTRELNRSGTLTTR